MGTRKRSQARMLAVQALCLFDAAGEAFRQELDDFLADTTNHADLGWHRPPDPAVLNFARQLALGAWEHRRAADELLQMHVPDWSIERMQPADRNILRLGVYELREQPQTPPAVVLNEAVELARQFGGNESAAFVNGVLDALRRALHDQGQPDRTSRTTGGGQEVV